MCGDAVAPGATSCPTCGEERVVAPAAVAGLPRGVRRRLRLVQGLRVLVVVAVVVGVAYAILSAVVAGPPSYPDPLTTKGVYSVPAGNFTYLAGAITGEDYIVGNYSVLNPPGATAVFEVFNATEMIEFAHHRTATPVQASSAVRSGQIVFDAPYTDTFYLVFVNPYAPTTGIDIQLFVTTTYQSNVVLG